MTRIEALNRAEALITLGWHQYPQRLAEALIEAAKEGLTLPAFPEDRCRVCGWPIMERIQDGCTKESCSQRPAPARRADEGYASVAQGKGEL